MKSLIEISKIGEIFAHIISYLPDKAKVLLLFCSKTFNNNRELLKFESNYDFHQVRNQWCFPYIKNIFINGSINCPDFELEIIKFIEKSSLDPTLINPTHIELILGGNKINLHYSSHLFHQLIIRKHYDIVIKILSIITNKNEILLESCKNGHLGVAKLLINRGANIHAQNNRAIILASSCGYFSIVELLIKSGADIRAQHSAALKFAIINDHQDIIDLLLKNWLLIINF